MFRQTDSNLKEKTNFTIQFQGPQSFYSGYYNLYSCVECSQNACEKISIFMFTLKSTIITMKYSPLFKVNIKCPTTFKVIGVGVLIHFLIRSKVNSDHLFFKLYITSQKKTNFKKRRLFLL